MQGQEPYRRALDGPTTIGRAIGCELWLGDEKLSRKHCRIIQRDGGWIVEDLKSTNGTRVGGREISSVPLMDGDVIEMGRTRVVYHADTFVERPQGPSRPSAPSTAPSADPGSTIADVPAGRALPKVPTAKPVPAVPQVKPAARPDQTIAFTRPPAKPKVNRD